MSARRLRTQTGAAAALAALALLAAVPAVHADADPPSDVLLLQDAYVPYRPVIPRAQHAALLDLLGRAKKAKFPIKVAIVVTASDLGAIPRLLDRPVAYARFLETEIRTPHRGAPLLTVMPNGYGTAATGARGAKVVAALPAPGHTAAGLVTGALRAVERLAAANGHALDTRDLGAHTSAGDGRSSPLLFAAPLVAATILVAILLLRGRHGGEDEEDDERERRPRPFDWEGPEGLA